MTMMKMIPKSNSNSVKITSTEDGLIINCPSDLGKELETLKTDTNSKPSSTSDFSLKRHGSIGMTKTMIILLLLSSSLLGMGNGFKINSNGGYEDVVVSIEEGTPPIVCQAIIQNLQSIFTSASELLSTATKGRAYFQKVNIIIPSTWDRRGCGKMTPTIYTSAASIRDAHFKIGGEHPVFGHNAWTQQSKGCGKQGDAIMASHQMVLQQNDTDTTPPDRAFVKEWMKFRYGVFEETGFENDPVYPARKHGENKDEKRGTSCKWSASVPFFNENDNATRICLNKQRFQCEGKSIAEVIYGHPDFRNLTISRNGRIKAPEFAIKQIASPRFVLMVEENGSMNLRDVWKFAKLAVRKFIKYDLPLGTQIGLLTFSSDIKVVANMTTLDDNLRAILAEKLPSYPKIEHGGGTLSFRKGILHCINMLKGTRTSGQGEQHVGGSVIILISQGTISSMELEAATHLLRQEEVSIATIEYPSIGDGKISALSQATNSPHFAIRETGVGTVSHQSTYIQLVNSLMEIQRFFTKGIAQKWPTLLHQAEFNGDSGSIVEGQFLFNSNQSPGGEFHVYIPSTSDPKLNKVEVISPSGVIYSDHTSTLSDINVMRMSVPLTETGTWIYRIDRLGDSHQSHFVQVVSMSSSSTDEVTARVYSNVEDETRGLNFSHMPLILYVEVKRGLSPVVNADVEALIVAGTHKWTIKLYDNGNGDPDLTKDDGIYSRYVIPPSSIQSAVLEMTVKVRSSPYKTKYIGNDLTLGSHSSWRRKQNNEPCCGSQLISPDSTTLKTMAYTERIAFYSVKVSGVRTSEFYPPSRIGDLYIVASYDTQVTLTFTAPGDDYDHKTVQMYQVYYKRTLDSIPVLKEEVLSQDIPAGSAVNMTIRLPSHGKFYLSIIAVDSYGTKGKVSNTVEVRAEPPPPETNTGSSESQIDIASKKNSEGKLTSTDIALIIVGVIAFFILLAIIIVLCVYCRRRGSKGMGSTETKISTISETSKAPIHWSASQLLSEHEKRQSMYAPSTASQQGSYGQTNAHHIGHYNGSPGSSTRSFRSISDNARKTSVDYESCSSDPTVRSAKGGGPTDYETPIEESDQENYRTIDSYHGVPPYRMINGVPHHNHNIPRGANIPVNPTSHIQYNPNLQGSLTSVNSKARRNITMV